MKKRMGVYSSGILANLTDGHNVLLYQTNIGQTVDFTDEFPRHRDSSYPPPILMSDALPSNRPSLNYEVEHSLCNVVGG